MTAVAETPLARKRSATTLSDQSESEQSSISDHDFQPSAHSDLSGEEAVDLEDLESDVGSESASDAESEVSINNTDASSLCSAKQLTYGAWEGAPSCRQDGFTAFASSVMRADGVGSALSCQQGPGGIARCPALQSHQRAVVCLLQPGSPVSRLLVYHPTGSGKTREMIEVLDSFFYDQRPKVPIFPKEPVCHNFYQELLRWPSRYRNFFALLKPEEAAIACGTCDWRAHQSDLWSLVGLPQADVHKICRAIRDALEMKDWFHMGRMRQSRRLDFHRRFPGEPLPAAPLRALRYTSAGGCHAELGSDGLPCSALFKVGFEVGDNNIYSNKIVILDEAHNLVRTQTLYGKQLERLRKLLYCARGTVLAAFTGTPILSDLQEGRQLLDVVKGCGALPGDEGFISAFPMRPSSLFPRSLPAGLPDVVLTPKIRRHFVRRIQLHGEPLQKYDKKRCSGASASSLRAYCNLCVHFGSFHEGAGGSRSRILDNMEACAPKLQMIAHEVISCPAKSLVLIQRNSGMEVLLEHLRRSAAKLDELRFGVATMNELAEFNSPANLRGELYRVLVADSSQCSEGVSFLAVRRVHLADVPASFGAFMQSVGRAIRMHGHHGLPQEEWTVTTTLYVAGLPRWLRSPLGLWAFRTQKQRVNPNETQSCTRKFLRKLFSLGIRSLADLKSRLDVHLQQEELCSDVQKSIDGISCADFLDQLGLWDEARDMRKRHLAREHRVGALFEQDAQKVGVAAGASELKSTHLVRLRRLDRQKGHASTSQDHEEGTTVNIPQRQKPRDRMLSAFKDLHAARCAHAAAEMMYFSPKTADEESLHQLAQHSKDIIPALVELQENAVDRDVLQGCMRETTHDVNSEGESSPYEFGISDSSNDDTYGKQQSAQKQKRKIPRTGTAGLALLPGWRTERVNHGKTTNREFIDPQGRRYMSVEKARVALDAARRTENISKRLSAKFAAKFGREHGPAA